MSLNKAMLIGRLGRDPEVRYTKAGQAVANFSMATDDNWRDKQGNRQERTEWHNIVVFGNQADFVQNYLSKGRLVFVEGRLQTREWTDNQNVRHFRTEIVANNVRALDRPPEGAGGRPGAAAGGGRPAGPQQGPPVRDQPGAYDQGAPPGDDEPPYIEDDIPF